MLAIGELVLLTFKLSASQVPMVPDVNQTGVFSEDWFSQVGFVLMGLYTLRLLFSFTVGLAQQYHMAVEELYMTGDFSDTESDKLFHEQAVKSGKIRFEKKLKQLKDHNDLKTVKESVNENFLPTLPDQHNYQPSPVGAQSMLEKYSTTKTHRDTDTRQERNYSAYNSFTLK